MVELAAKSIHQSSRYGNYIVEVFKELNTSKEHLVLSKGNLENEIVYCRIQSECTTGIIFDSNSCDCNEQLEFSLSFMKDKKTALLLFMREEGRGNGLTVKIKALNNKNKGIDTFKSVELLGYQSDTRDYKIAIEILKQKSVQKINLITNNPDKINAFTNESIKLNRVVNIPITNNPNLKLHLDAKIKKGHYINYK